MKTKYNTSLRNYKEIILIFLTAFFIRLFFWHTFGTILSLSNSDSLEYYISSVNFEPLEVHKLFWGYSEWYQRTPIYILFLHLIGRQLIFQVLLSALGCALMYRMNKTAGLIWVLYPQDIIYSFQYAKETLLLFMVICAIYFLRNNRKFLLAAIPLIILGFVSYGGVISTNHSLSKGFMSNFWNLWKPAFNLSVIFSRYFVYIQFLPYVISMFYFLRNVKLLSIEFGIFLILTLVYSVIYSEPRYREPFMPLLVLYIAEPCKAYLKNFGKINLKEYLSEHSLKSIFNGNDSRQPVYRPDFSVKVSVLTDCNSGTAERLNYYDKNQYFRTYADKTKNYS